MPRIVGIFAERSALDAVVQQIELNGMTARAIMDGAAEHAVGAADDGSDAQLAALRLPEGQAAEYRRRLAQGQCLLIVDVGALELPTVQRALRSGQAVDIDILPESGS